MKRYYGYLALLLTAFIFATFTIYIRFLSQELNAYQQTFFRGFLGFLLSGGIVLFLKKKPDLSQISKPVLLAYALLFPLAAIFFTQSILTAKVGTTIFGFYTSSLFATLILGVVFFKEKIQRTQQIALIMAFIGLGIYTYPHTWASFNTGLIFALVAGILDSGAMALRKVVTQKMDRWVLVVIQMLGMALVGLPFAFLTLSQGAPTLSWPMWAVGIWYGLMLIAVNYLLLYAFSNFDLNLGTIVLSSELFFAVVLAYLVFGETTKPQELFGSVLIFLATGLAGIDAKVFSKVLNRRGR